jgi:hypothetical protein
MSKAKPYHCEHFSACERKSLCNSQCKKCTHCKEDLNDVLLDTSKTIFYKEK